MDKSSLHRAIIAHFCQSIPALWAIYLFGSQANGQAQQGSDLDVAILFDGKIDPVTLWQHGQNLAAQLNIDVDLIDLRQASTVMQYQIISTGIRLWHSNHHATQYESFILSSKTSPNEARANILNSLAHRGLVLERYIQRAKDEYNKDPNSFATDFTRQDAAILNVQRACEAALDMGQHVIRRDRLGVPQSSRDVFALLLQAQYIDATLAKQLQNMVGW